MIIVKDIEIVISKKLKVRIVLICDFLRFNAHANNVMFFKSKHIIWMVRGV